MFDILMKSIDKHVFAYYNLIIKQMFDLGGLQNERKETHTS